MLIREKDRQTLMQIFSEEDIPMEVWAYGSRINGTAHEGSDLDLVIRSKNLKPFPLSVYSAICEKIKDSNIPILVELRDWAMLPESFHRNISMKYEVLYSNQQ
ncbi:MAG: nucleotidyltransferase domain-containing protein [Chitinophagales bacterium]|nr:nucleotidyltransferase domain-containing protein [Chitinophagales bacterium]